MKIQTPAKLTESLGVDHTTVSKRLKVLGMIKKQRHYAVGAVRVEAEKCRTASFHM